MKDGSSIRAQRLPWLLFLGFWTLFGLIYAQLYWSSAARRGDPIPLARALAIGLLDMYSWIPVVLVAWWLARRIPLDRGRWLIGIAQHLAFGVVLLGGRMLLLYGVNRVLPWDPGRGLASWLGVIPAQLLTYSLIVGVGYAIDYYRRYRDREIASARLEAQLSDARLTALKMQLHPHFLFNTLNAVSALMHRDVAAAERVLARLGDLLRLTLETAGTQQATLRDELNFLEPYLEIEQTRLGDRLSVEWEIEPDSYDARVPHLILQPLVENAIKHGIAPRAEPGEIRISVRRVGSALRLTVADNGQGFSGGQSTPRNGKGTGVGLTNIRARLAQLYNGQHSFEIRDREGGGTTVTLEIPFAVSPNGENSLERRMDGESAYTGR